MSAIKCSCCDRPIYENEFLKCCSCKLNYYFVCGGVSEETFRKRKAHYQNSWRCKTCRSKERDEDASNSQLRQGNKDKDFDTPSNSCQDPSPLLSPEMAALTAYLDKKFEDAKSDWSKKLDHVITVTDEKYTHLCAKLQEIDGKYAELPNKMKDLEIKQTNDMTILNAKVQGTISANEERFKRLEAAAENASLKYDDLIKKYEELPSKVDKLAKNNEQLTSSIAKVCAKCKTFDKFSRQNNVEIHNITERKDENLTQIMITIGQVLGCDINQRDIVHIHRVNHKDSKDSRPKNIVAKLTSRMLRDDLVKAARKTKKNLSTESLQISGTSRRVYVNEHMSLEQKLLYRSARRRCQDKKFKFVWVQHGSILVRKEADSVIYNIDSECDLELIN